jgi:hypothetical protein
MILGHKNPNSKLILNLTRKDMKKITLCTLIFVAVILSRITNAQTSPPNDAILSFKSGAMKPLFLSDTITFTPYETGDIMTNQYQSDGVIFSGFNGSTAPVVYEYSNFFGKVLHSDNWYNALRMNFVDTTNASHYHLAQKIEFDNIQNTEVDYMSIDVYDSTNNLITHYLSKSPEHVIFDFGIPKAAYLTIDDSAGTAYIVDNILVDFDIGTGTADISKHNFVIFPNPSQGIIHISGESIFDKIEVINLTGKIISQTMPKEKNVLLQIDNKGIYFMKVTQGTKTFTEKFTISY